MGLGTGSANSSSLLPRGHLPALTALAEPVNLAALKGEIEQRWGTLELLDVLKDADHLSGFTNEFASVASREVLDRATLRRRLLLVLFALGTNRGIRHVVDAAGGEATGDTEATLRRVRRLWVKARYSGT